MENAKEKVTETINGNLVAVRKPLKDKDGKPYRSQSGNDCYGYVVKGYVRGKEYEVDFMPKDTGGYEPLDIVFDVSDRAELIMTEEEMTDDHGRKTRYTTYKLQTVDENGVVYSVGVKPQRDSDKTLLQMILNALN